MTQIFTTCVHAFVSHISKGAMNFEIRLNHPMRHITYLYFDHFHGNIRMVDFGRAIYSIKPHLFSIKKNFKLQYYDHKEVIYYYIKLKKCIC